MKRIGAALGVTMARGGLLAPASCAAVALLAVLNCELWKNLNQSLTRMLALVPESLRPLMGGRQADLTTLMGYLGVLFQHPIPLALLAVAAIGSAGRAIAGEVENGTADLLFARPLSRTTVLGAHVLAAVLRLLVIVAGFPLGVAAGATLTGQWQLVDIGRCVGASAVLLALFLCVFGYALIFSALSRTVAVVYGASAALTVSFFLLNLFGEVKPTWHTFKYFTPFALLRSSALLSGTAAPEPAFAQLAGLAAAGVVVSWYLLRRRDL